MYRTVLVCGKCKDKVTSLKSDKSTKYVGLCVKCYPKDKDANRTET
jgi:hypothetical protein